MVNTKKVSKKPDSDLQSCLDSIPDNTNRLVLAFSGGVDSCVLLHLLSQRTDSFEISPWHINHGLQDSAEEMETLCRVIASEYGFKLKTSHLHLDPHQGNLESRARKSRYGLFEQALKPRDCLLTAHHADDQFETFLLNTLRGSGSAGLRGIARIRPIGQSILLRPLLNISREEIFDYATRHGLKWFDDPSNASNRFDRNYLRHDVIPLIKKRWPGYLGSIQSVTEIQAETETVLRDLAIQDYATIQNQSEHQSSESLPISGLLELSLARQKNLIRHWLVQNSRTGLPQSRLTELVSQIQAKRHSGSMIRGTDYSVRIYNHCLFIVSDEVSPSLLETYDFDRSMVLKINAIDLEIKRDEVIRYLNEKDNGQAIRLVFRIRDNAPNPAHHRLKRLFQKHKVPPWKRATTPQIYLDNELLGLWI